MARRALRARRRLHRRRRHARRPPLRLARRRARSHTRTHARTHAYTLRQSHARTRAQALTLRQSHSSTYPRPRTHALRCRRTPTHICHLCSGLRARASVGAAALCAHARTAAQQPHARAHS
eukprot:802946-Pleurochrysis_carterae.AAC.1